MNDYDYQNGFYSYQQKHKKKKKKYGVKMIIFTCILSALIGFGGAFGGTAYRLVRLGTFVFFGKPQWFFFVCVFRLCRK